MTDGRSHGARGWRVHNQRKPFAESVRILAGLPSRTSKSKEQPMVSMQKVSGQDFVEFSHSRFSTLPLIRRTNTRLRRHHRRRSPLTHSRISDGRRCPLNIRLKMTTKTWKVSPRGRMSRSMHFSGPEPILRSCRNGLFRSLPPARSFGRPRLSRLN